MTQNDDQKPTPKTARDNRLRMLLGRLVRWSVPIYHGGAVPCATNPCDLFDYLRDLNFRIKRLENLYGENHRDQ